MLRLVKMKFTSEGVHAFLHIFSQSRDLIAAAPGCLHLELRRDMEDPDVFFTVSHWKTETDLENYRNSELFARTWARTKVLFAAKPEAWSLAET
ncbi:MAG TPA: antibiotic biosynthesis monooxygenase family protein [Bacteroidia bacterium]|nr:antibiotic biosynthesis monooxygenase family protein [Bacteroidia bacterium]